MHTTYLCIIEIHSGGMGELETALVELARRYPVTWQAGPREFKVSKGTAAFAAMTKDNAPSSNPVSAPAPHDHAQKN